VSERRAALEEIISEAQKELNRIKSAENIAEREQLVGRYFKYADNSYSCPSKPEDYWDVFYHVIGLGDDGWLVVSKFETDCRNAIRVQLDTKPGCDDLIEITAEEWGVAFVKLQHLLRNMLQADLAEARKLLEGE
jgi:hypothetical protein